jgi:hypothetical protein
MDLSKLSLSDKIIGGTGIVLLIDLLFLPWHKIDLGFVSASRSAIESPNSFWGVLALLVTLVVVGVIAVTRFTTTAMPDLPVPLNRAVFFATIVVLVLLLIKLVSETDYLGFGCYLAILLSAGMVYGGFLRSQEAEAA